MQKQTLAKFNMLYEKFLGKVGPAGTYLSTVKAIYDKPTVRIIPNGEKVKAIHFFLNFISNFVKIMTVADLLNWAHFSI